MTEGRDEGSGFGSRAHTVPQLIWLVLALGTVALVTYEFAFVHEPRLGTSIVLYAVDVAFLAAIWVGNRDARSSGSRTETRMGLGPDGGALNLRVFLGSLPIDILFLGFVAGPWGISLALWVRLLRLLRLGTVFGIMRRLERHWSTNTAAFRIGRLFVVVLVVIHLLSCVWFLVAFVGGPPADSWLVVEGVTDESTGFLYLLSLYWVVTAATTVGFGDITPGNGIEYVFSLFVMLIGASLFAYAIATMASLISDLNLSRVAFWNRVETVQSYLRSRSVDAHVSRDVRRYYEYLWEEHRGLSERSLLVDLPPPLRLQVLEELMRDLLPNVPVFRLAPQALRTELLNSLEPMVVPPGSHLVRVGEVSDGIYFVAAGTAEVLGQEDDEVKALLNPGDYFGDLSLMLGERRGGSVRAKEFMEVFRLSAADFRRIRDEYPELREVLTNASNEKSESVAHLVMEGIVL